MTFRWAVLAAISLVVGSPAAAEERISFNRDIRPILSDSCFFCHGPDEQKREGNLRLDIAAAAYKGGDSGPAIVPGKIDMSEVWRRVTSTDPNVQMPPPTSGKSLKPAQIETLKRWITSGAEYQGHWAFLSVERPAVPSVEGTTNPIDAFIRERLKREGMASSNEASRETLIRRLTLDLTGLPPTLGEIDAFLSDKSPQAYERIVDRLLSSPHYGERMAQQWLDFARYADSNGFQTDSSRQMWGWRDWVISAFNRNQPFDQFTIEQLAGDLLPNATTPQIIATGFNRNMRLNGEGGRIVEEWFVETVIDRLETVGLTWMGLTLNCCRCHDHKYDPISQKEFFQLFAFFNSIDESGVLEGANQAGGNSRPILRAPTPVQEEELAKRQLLVKAAEADVAEKRKSLPQRQTEWEKEFTRQIDGDVQTWRLITPKEVISSGGATFTELPDHTWLASGKNPPHDEYKVIGTIDPGQFTGVLLEAFPDESLPNKSLGRYPNGNFVLTDVDAEITAPSLKQPLRAQFTRAEADYEQKGYSVKMIVDGKTARKGKNRQGWAIDGPTKREPRKAMFVASSPLEIPEGAVISITLRHDAISGHNIGRFRLSVASLPSASLKLDGSSVPDDLRNALSIAKTKRSAEQRKVVEKYFREHGDGPLKQAERTLLDAKEVVTKYEQSFANVMVLKERPEPRDAFLLLRGQYDRRGEKVGRGLPAALSPMPKDAPLNRLGFAQWLTAPNHPLTSRVWVNRAWERFFGAGLVRTTENLGSQSEWPSHPELLDWLAAEFMSPTVLPAVNGEAAVAWDMKALQKLIVMSATYRQSAKVTTPADPENRLLARGPRFRLAAETARDQALAVSGLLVPKIGGPSVRPYMPEGIWDETSRYGDLRGYKADAGEGLYRRSLYTIWKRTAAPPSMMLFDAPSREVCTVKRSRTNTPLQALALLNEVTYVEAGRRLAERMIVEGGQSVEQRLSYGFRLVTGRNPQDAELKILRSGLNEDLARFQKDSEAAKKLNSFGSSNSSANLNSSELAAFALTANILLNLDEAVTRE